MTERRGRARTGSNARHARADTTTLVTRSASDLIVVIIRRDDRGNITSAVVRRRAAERWIKQLDALIDDVLTAGEPETERAALVSLTDRERAILARLARGASTREIADDLYVSPSTVRNHYAAIYNKLGVANRGALLAALRPGDEVGVPGT
jgi:DNA-binding NarL/FixJ family response regulator